MEVRERVRFYVSLEDVDRWTPLIALFFVCLCTFFHLFSMKAQFLTKIN